MRLVNVIKKDFKEERRSWTIYGATIIAIIAGLALISALLTKNQVISNADPVYKEFFFWFLFLGGAISVSTSFEDMFNRTKQHNFLMLPASSFEKFLSRAIISTVLYPLVLLALMSALSLVLEPLLLLLFGDPMTLFNPLSASIIRSIPLFFLVNSLFFLGSTYFRKNHFIKTVFFSWLVLLSLGMIAMLFSRIFLASSFFTMQTFQIRVSYLEGSFTFSPFWEWIWNIILYIALPLFLFYVSYLRIEEVQATDAIQ